MALIEYDWCLCKNKILRYNAELLSIPFEDTEIRPSTSQVDGRHISEIVLLIPQSWIY